MLKVMRRLVVLSLFTGLLGGAYVAAPFYTAWTIREAVKSNDAAYLERKLEWPQVRASLKESLSKFALNSSGELIPSPDKPSWWQRMKAYFGKGAIDRFVDTAVTPTGLHGVLVMRRNYQSTFSTEDETKRPHFVERVRRLWSRVTRAEFTRLDRLELEIVDKHEPDRTVACALELKSSGFYFEWKLTELRIKPTDKTAARLQLASN